MKVWSLTFSHQEDTSDPILYREDHPPSEQDIYKEFLEYWGGDEGEESYLRYVGTLFRPDPDYWKGLYKLQLVEVR